KGHDFALGAAAGKGVIFDGQGPLLVDGPSDGGQYVQIGMRESGWNLTGYPGSQPGWFAIAKPLGQPGQDPLGLEVKNGFEVLAEYVVLGFGVVVDIRSEERRVGSEWRSRCVRDRCTRRQQRG